MTVHPSVLRRHWARVRLLRWTSEEFYQWLDDNFNKTHLRDLTPGQFTEMFDLMGKMPIPGSKLNVKTKELMMLLSAKLIKNRSDGRPQAREAYLRAVCKNITGIDNPDWLDGKASRKVIEALKNAERKHASKNV